MLKRSTLFLSLFLFLGIAFNIQAQDANNDGYHDDDVACLEKILANNNSIGALTWQGNDYSTYEGITWDDGILKRIISISIDNKSLTGTLNVSACAELTTLNCSTNYLSILDISNNYKLLELFCYDNNINTLDVSGNTLLTTINCSRNSLNRLNLSLNTSLTSFDGRYNPFTYINIKNGSNEILTTFITAPLYNSLICMQVDNIDDFNFKEYTKDIYCSDCNFNGINLPLIDYNSIVHINAEGPVNELPKPTMLGNNHEIVNIYHNTPLPITIIGLTTVTWFFDYGNGIIKSAEQYIVINEPNTSLIKDIIINNPIPLPYYFQPCIDREVFISNGIIELDVVDINSQVKKLSELNSTIEFIQLSAPQCSNYLLTYYGDFFPDYPILSTLIYNKGRVRHPFILKMTNEKGQSTMRVSEIASEIQFRMEGLQLSDYKVDENITIGNTVGTFTPSNLKSARNYTYSIKDNALFAIEGDELITKKVPNYESLNHNLIEVTVTRDGGCEYTGYFEITINDVNEAPTTIELSNSNIYENMDVGTFIGTLGATDEDSNQTFTYSIAENNNFEIIGDKLLSKAVFDYESQDSYSVELTVADQDGLTHKQSFTISVQDINEKPTDISLSNNIWVENAPAGTLIGTLSAEDPDANQTFTFSTIQPEFEITGDEIFVKVPLDRESYSENTGGQGINIVVTDQNGASFNKVFGMRFKDVNEAPTAIQLSGKIVVENAAVGTIIGDLSATDEDYNESFVFSISENDFFEIVDNKLQVKGDVNYEEQLSHNLEITVTDKGGLNFKQSFIVQITDANEAPSAIQLSNATIAENSGIGTEVGTLIASDEDAEQTFIYTIAENVNFEIVGDKLVTKSVFDFETKNSYSVEIKVEDQDGLSHTQSLTIQVEDINEAPTAIQFTKNSIAENSAVGTEVGTFTASDVDANQTFSYTIAENENFEIVGDKLVTKSVFDFETKNSYSVEIKVEDQDGLSHTQSLTIQVEDKNETPSAIQLSKSTITENSSIVTEIGKLSATDEDANQVFTYSLAENENFVIIADRLVTKAVFDYETQNGYSVEITVTDQGGLSHTQSFTISIEDVNEAPTAIQLSNSSITENSAVGTEVGILTARDEDANQTFTYSITENDNFEIVDGKLVTKAAFDFETKNSYSVEIKVEDQDGLSHTQSFTIQVEDLNETPTAIQLSSSTLAENSDVGMEVGTLTTSDPDANQTFIYTITENENFELVGDKLISKKEFDYETMDSYSVEVTVTDQGGLSFMESFEIQITDTNDAPTAIQLSNSNIAENSAVGTDVGTLTASDVDANQTFTYSITENENFELAGEKLISKKEFDYEAKNSYSVEIKVEDQDGLSHIQTVTIEIEDVNEAPTAIQLSNSSIAENLAIGTEVRTLTTSDPDANQTFTYTITENENFELAGEKLISKKEFDYEAKNSYSVEIKVEDQDGLSHSQSLTIQVEDINEAPTAIQLSNANTAENSDVGTEVGTLTANDVDANQTFSYTIAENENFEIVGDKLVTKVAFDYEAQNSYSVEVTVTDQGGLSFKESFEIQITDANDAPTAIQLSNSNIAENSAVGTEVGTLTASDVDANQTFFYTIAENENFEIVGGKLVTKSVFDFETKNSYSVEIKVEDQDGLSHTQSLTIQVEDINEAPTAIQLSNSRIAENLAVGTEVGTLTASDVDANQTFTYTIAGNDNFEIVSNKLVTKAAFDYETMDSYLVEITVTDQGGLTHKQIFTIDITDENEAPTAIALSNATIAENSAIGTEVGVLSASDEDSDQTLAYTIAENENFEIVADKLVSKAVFDFETQDSYSFEITVTDQGGLTHKQSFSIEILDANDAPNEIQLSNATITENSAIGTEVGALTATDVDAAQAFTYTMAENVNFEIVGDMLVSKSDLDFETKDSYSVEITVTDQGGLTHKQIFTIDITDENEAPTVIALSNATIAENSAIGTLVGALTASDVDANQSFIYTIAENENFEIEGGKLISKAAFDFETQDSYSVEITVTDQGGLTHKQSFSIEITDANEAPSAIQLSNIVIAENSAIGTEIGTLTASDEDANQTLTFTIAENEFFKLAGNKLVSKTAFDFEIKYSYSVEISVIDQDGLSFINDFSIQIENVNEAPVFTSEAITEGVEAVEYIYTVECMDIDGDAISLQAIEKPEWLNLVDNGDGTCTLSGTPARGGLYHVILEASDSEFTVQQEFDIEVEVVTGIEPDFTESLVNIYPNPVVNELHIDLSNFQGEELSIALYSLIGKLIFKEVHQNIGEEVSIRKSLQHLRSGIYLLIIESDGSRKTYKIVKK